jgi:hypothetical protein
MEKEEMAEMLRKKLKEMIARVRSRCIGRTDMQRRCWYCT